LQGAITWRNQCHDRATLQGVIIPSAILKIVFRHMLLFCFFKCSFGFDELRLLYRLQYTCFIWWKTLKLYEISYVVMYKLLMFEIINIYSAKVELCDPYCLSVCRPVCHSVSRIIHERDNACWPGRHGKGLIV